ncbi:MAG: hypothetical protein K2F69_05155 [Bacteroidaceae bacterium]|nr:hypothetical protein [Bacteroidaceae bacterium]
MHFVLSYDLSAQGTRRSEIEEKIENVLSPYKHVKRLSTFYIVLIRVDSDWEAIRSSLTALSQEISETFHFIMSPSMEGGKYNGILQKGEWDEINAITNA